MTRFYFLLQLTAPK